MESTINAIKPAKGAHGGFRPNAGRKKLAESPTGSVRKAIKAALRKRPKALQAIWLKVMEEAEKGNTKCIDILFSYHYGKPIETMEVHTKTIIVKRIIVSDGNVNT